MHTSRAQVDRILKAKGNITIDSLQRAAAWSAGNSASNLSEGAEKDDEGA